MINENYDLFMEKTSKSRLVYVADDLRGTSVLTTQSWTTTIMIKYNKYIILNSMSCHATKTASSVPTKVRPTRGISHSFHLSEFLWAPPTT